MKDWIKNLSELGACRVALEWANQYDSLSEAWAKCERGDWMLWLVGRLSGEPDNEKRRKLVLCSCRCARLALPHVRKGEDRPLKAIETAEAWARNEDGVTLEEVMAAAADTYTAYISYAAHISYVATNAAYAAANASYVAANTAYVVAKAAAYEDAYDSRQKTLKQCADIVRQYYPDINLAGRE